MTKALLLVVVLAFGAIAQAQVTPLPATSGTLILAGLEDSFQELGVLAQTSVASVVTVNTGVAAEVEHKPLAWTGARLMSSLVGQPITMGTAFCIDSPEWMLTANHVVEEAQWIWVVNDKGRLQEAKLFASDPWLDLALLHVPSGTYTPARIAMAAPVRGAWCVVMGNPMGVSSRGGLSMSTGVIAATDRDLPDLRRREGTAMSQLIQTTAETPQGFSGGPVFNLQGEVLGVVLAVRTPAHGAWGMSYALPFDERTHRSLHAMREGRAVQYAFLGVELLDTRDGSKGVEVSRVLDEGPASGVIEVGDHIMSVEGVPTASVAALVRVVELLDVSRPATLRVVRQGKEVLLQLLPGIINQVSETKDPA